jgi:hypothetical protein
MSGRHILFTETSIFRDTYEVSLKLYRLTTKFSKQFKYSLGTRIIDSSLDLIDLLYKCNSVGDIKEKLVHIDKFINTQELLKIQLRLGEELGAIPRKNLSSIHLLMESIGKQIHGIKRNYKNKLA